MDQLVVRLRGGDVKVVDVRGASEWEAGHLPGVPNIPLASFSERLKEVPVDLPLVVHCQSGARSAIASSVLLANGFKDVLNLTGGYKAWIRARKASESGALVSVGK